MIAKLTGLIDDIGSDWAVLDVNGVGYLVYCPSRVLSQLAVGERASLAVETHVREDHIHLFGFLSADEREWFRLLCTVQGVGAKVALAILSVLGPDQLIQAIAAQDRAALSRADGVGPKLAGRIAAELKDKAGRIALGAAARQGPAATGQPMAAAPIVAPGFAGGAASDAVSALVNLGYGHAEALGAVGAAAQRLGEEADLASLIRAGLQDLGPGGNA